MSHRQHRARTRTAGTAADTTTAVTASPPAPAILPQGGAASISSVIPVVGMTCRSCEIRIERNVRRIPGVERVSASAVSARVTIVSTGPVPEAAVAEAIEAAGYAVGRTPWVEHDPNAWITAANGLIVLGLIAVVAKLTGLGTLGSGVGDLSQGGVAVAVLLGLAAGVSTCAALVGGIVLALSASYQARRPAAVGGPDVVGRLRPAVAFVVGRVLGYAAFGAVLGAIGSAISLPTQATAVLMIVAAVAMTLVGARLTGLSPRIAGWSPTLPMGVARGLGFTDGHVGAYSDGRAALLGALSFFLPCGFTQAVQIYALSTGSPIVASVLLAAFAIGTAPGLLAIGGLPAVLPDRFRPSILRIVGVVVIGFAVVNASAGLRLAGFTPPSLFASPVAAAAATTSSIVGEAQELRTFQDLEGYKPAEVTIYAGTPTRWTIESKDAASCASFLRVPALGIAVTLHRGTNVIDLPAMQAGTLDYMCSMGMYGGRITIVDAPASGSDS
jgi:uncharacterized protein